MNLRDIKKDIEYVLSAFVEDCSIFATVNSNASEDSIAKLLDQAVATYNEFKAKVNAKNIEGSKKIYFLKLRKELLQKTDALYEQLSQAVKSASKEEAPAEKKPAAKKPAAKKTAEAKPAAEKKPAAERKPAAKKAAAKKAE